MNKEKAIDGRQKRHINNKQKTVEAMLEMILERDEVPSIEEIAEKAEVSRRSVFRFFNNRDELFLEVNKLMYRRINKLFPFPEPDSKRSLEATIKLFINQWIKINEYITPVRKIGEGKKMKVLLSVIL